MRRRRASWLRQARLGDPPLNPSPETNSFLHTLSNGTLHTCPELTAQKPGQKLKNSGEHSRTFNFKIQTTVSIRCRTPNSTYNIPKQREKHEEQHRIIKSIKKSRLQKFTI